MQNIKERAELADICYMIIERECAKPLENINTELVDSCIELAGLLLDIHPLSDDELTEAKQKLTTMTLFRRKRIRIRIVAAIVAILILLGTTVYALSDWLESVFGKETIQTIEPGDKVVVENNEMESAQKFIIFDSTEKLLKYVDDHIYFPIQHPDGYELLEARVEDYEYRVIDVSWVKNNDIITYIVSFDPPYFNESGFAEHDYEYYTQDGHPFDIFQVDDNWQATGWINNNEYIILAKTPDLLKEFIDNMILCN